MGFGFGKGFVIVIIIAIILSIALEDWRNGAVLVGVYAVVKIVWNILTK